MNLGEYLAKIILEADDQPEQTIALFPGDFKPPYKEHFEAVEKLLKTADQVVILISPKIKDGITADESVSVWNLYKPKFNGPVEIKISATNPFEELHKVISENPDTNFIVATNKNISDVERHSNAKVFDVKDSEGSDATNLRMALAQKNEEEIAKYLPDGVSVEEFLQALNTEPKETPEEETQPAEEKPEETAFTSTPAPPEELTESPPINFEQDTYQNYILANRPKIEKAAATFNIPIDDMEYAFNGGTEVVLNDDMWKDMENTKSYNMKSLEDAISHALKTGINPKPYIDHIKQKKDIPLPLVLQWQQGKYYLVGGEVILSIYRSLGVIPTVLLATLNLQDKTLSEPIHENLIKEYSTGLINKLIQKFKQEDPTLTDDEIKQVIKRFDQIKNNIEQKDILRYTWDDLVDTASSIEPKRIKAGKINNGEVDNADLVYNQNNLRVYKAGNKKACIKYGHGYTFCISARGSRNAYAQYRMGMGLIGPKIPSLTYFVFDDSKSSEKNKKGTFVNKTHLLVVMADENKGYYITEADNITNHYYETFEEAAKKYSQLKGLKDILIYHSPSENDPDIKIELIQQEKEKALKNYKKNKPIKGSLSLGADKDIATSLLNNSLKLFQWEAINKINGNIEISTQNNILSSEEKMIDYAKSTEKKFLLSGEKVNVIYKNIPITGEIKEYLLGFVELLNKYDKKIARIKLQSLNEGIENDDDKKLLKEFISFAVKKLGIKKLPSGLTLSRNNKDARSMHSFGTFNPNNDHIWLYVKNRNKADILRTLAHELVHRKQAEDGRINNNSGETGSEIENEANAMAGVLLREFGKMNENIYEVKKNFGDYLFGDKESGVKIGWYDSEKEEDTPAEMELFKLLKKYADSEAEIYSNISLDNLIPVFKKIKKQYPEIGEVKVNGYIYRGTAIPEEKLRELEAGAKIEPYSQGEIILNRTYSSRRKVSSWSIEYFPAAGFAITTAEEKGGVPVIMRAKASDAELFFNPKFMEKLSTQLEDETFNIANPIPVDVMVIKDYKDEFEDIESGYLHNK